MSASQPQPILLRSAQSKPLPSGGVVRPISRWGTPVMHRQLAEITEYGHDLASLVADLTATMRAAAGVGLAANQIGVDCQVFVFDCPDADDRYVSGVVCNPQLVLPEGDDRQLTESDEGCLSLPGAYGQCARPDVASVTGTDQFGQAVQFNGTGLLARCLQHETDHLFGTVFGDRISERGRKKLYKMHEQFIADYPADWPANDGAPD